jgi:hypothetical protein
MAQLDKVTQVSVAIPYFSYYYVSGVSVVMLIYWSTLLTKESMQLLHTFESASVLLLTVC